MSKNPLQQRLISIVEPVLEAAGYELVDLRYVLEQGGWTLRIAVDLPLDEHTDPHEVPSDRVDLEDCENLSRELSAVLDVEDPIPQAFSLEVSSPGIDRPLRTPRHYRYFAGSEAKIQLAAPLMLAAGERRNFKGILQGVDERSESGGGDPAGSAGGAGSNAPRGIEDQPVAVIIDCDGTTFRLPIDDIEQAKLVPDWDAVMKGKSGVGKPVAKPIKPGHRASAKRGGPDQQHQASKAHRPSGPSDMGNDPATPSGKSPGGSRVTRREADRDRDAGVVTEGDWHSENKEQG